MCEYYIVQFIITSYNYYTIWHTDNNDEFVTKNKKILSFNNLEEVIQYAKLHSIELHEYITCYDIDRLMDDIDTKIDCNYIINFWNIISDIAKSIQINFCGDSDFYNSVYEKLLYGCNLNALNKSHYDPIWTNEEIDKIKYVVNIGYKLLCKSFLI